MEKKYYDYTCACGCGGKLEIKPCHNKGVPKYISGHNLKNMIRTEEHNKNIGKSGKGKHITPCSEERKQKYRDLWKEPEYRAKMIKALNQPDVIIKKMGANNPAWKGGISYGPYCPMWSDEEYKNILKERDNNKCQNPFCWGKNNELLLHHINYDKIDCNPKNLITVCRSCNGRANINRKTWEILYDWLTISRDHNIPIVLTETFEQLLEANNG